MAKAKTKYVVLQLTTAGSAEAWIERGHAIEASSPSVAIRQVAANVLDVAHALEDEQEVFIAVPQRSWKPTTVSTSVQTVLKVAR